MLPKIYDATNVYFNTIDNSYFMIIVCDYLYGDTNYRSFLNNFIDEIPNPDSNNNFSISVFSIESDKITLLDIKFLPQTLSLNINLETQQNLIMEGLFVRGITAEAWATETFANDTTLSYGNSFTINCITSKLFGSQYLNLNNKYRFPLLYSKVGTTLENANVYYMPKEHQNILPNSYNCYYVSTIRKFPLASALGYSDNNFSSHTVAKNYRNEYFTHFIPNVNDDSYVAIAYKTNQIADYHMLDIAKDGTCTTYKKENITSIQYIKDNIFQVVKNQILYECNLK